MNGIIFAVIIKRKPKYKMTKKFLRGFSLLEMSIVLAILVVFAGVAFFNLKTIVEKNRARICCHNLMVIKQAINNYCVDNNLKFGTLVNLSDLIAKGYIKQTDNLKCPETGQPYQTNFSYGADPICPSGIAGHICTTD